MVNFIKYWYKEFKYTNYYTKTIIVVLVIIAAVAIFKP